MTKSGKELIKLLLAEIPNSSGIYKMLDSTGNIIYIGKAKNLRKRLTNYTQNDLSNRIARMVFLVHNL